MSISTRFAMNLWIRLGCAVSSILVVLCALHIYVLLGRSEQYEALLVRSDASNVLRTIVPLLVNRSPIREPEFFRYASNVFALAPRYDVVIAEKTGSVILQSSIFNPEASWITNTQPYEPHPEAPALLSRKLWKAGSFEFDMLVPAPELGPELMVGIMAEPMSLRVGHFKILQKYATFLALFGLFGGPSLSFLLGYLAIRPLARQLEAIAKRLSDYMPGTGPLGIPLLVGADETREIADSLNRIVDAIGLEDQAIAEAERARRALLQSVIDDLSSPYRQATEQLRLALPPDVGNIDNLHLTRTLELTAEQERLATLLLELARLSHRREKPILESYLIAEVASDAIGALNAAGRHFTLSVDAKSTSVELTGDIEAASRMIRIVLEGLESRRADQFAAGVPVTVAPVDAPVGTPLASLENPPNISVQLRTGKDDRSELFVEVEIRSRSELDGLSREVLSEYTSRSGYRFNIAPEPNGSGTKLYTLRFE